MELKEGYKTTEVGVVPEEWRVMTLKELSFYRRGSFPQPYGLEKWYDDINGAPFVQVFDVGENRKIKPQTKRRISSEATALSVFAPKGTIILTIQGSIGRIAITQYDAYIDRTLLIFQAFHFEVNKLYLSFVIAELFDREKQNAPGGIIKTITKEALSSFRIALPPIAEQTAIATALSDMDALIAQTEALIAKKKAIKQGVMQRLLSPVDAKGDVKEGWVKVCLGDIVDVNMGQSPDSRHYNSSFVGLPLLQGNADIKNRLQVIRFFTSQPTKVCEAGDLVMTVRAPVGHVAFAIAKSCIGRGICSLKLKNVVREFLYYSLVYYEQEWKVLEQGSTFTSANSTQIRQFSISVPENLEEQKNISNTLSGIDNELDVLSRKLAKLQLQKQGMMQALLTGKIRIHQPHHEPATI